MSSRILFIYGLALVLILGLVFTYMAVGFWNAMLTLFGIGLAMLLIMA